MYRQLTNSIICFLSIPQLSQDLVLPLLLQFQAVHPAFHCVLLVLDSASEGTGQSVLLTQDLFLSVVTHRYM